MNYARILSLFFFAACVMLVTTSETHACSCARNPTVDRAFSQSANVVVLKVRSLEKTGTPQVPLVNAGGIKFTNLTVERVFKGDLKVGQEIKLVQGGGADCVWTFSEMDIGDDFLFYLDAAPEGGKGSEGVVAATGQFPKRVSAGMWMAWTCSRSGRSKYRVNDLKYLEDISEARGRSRLSGTLSKFISTAVEGEVPRLEMLSGHKVRVTGNGKTFELRTDEDGSYEIYDLPPGRYTIATEKVPGYRSNYGLESSAAVTLAAKGHAEHDFRFEVDNAVRGKLLDKNGKPLKDVCLDFVPAHNTPTLSSFPKFDCTEADGSWKIDSIPPGAYVIIVNKKGEVSARQPFGTFYYPSARSREEAGEISIGAGQVIENLQIVAPDTAEVVTVSGVLLHEDGLPVAKEGVEFFEASRAAARKPGTYLEPDSRVSTDGAGRFTLRILKGQTGILVGAFLTYSGEYVNCPKLEKLIKVYASGMSVGDINTPPVQIEAVRDVTGLELKFPFPSCKKRKID